MALPEEPATARPPILNSKSQDRISPPYQSSHQVENSCLRVHRLLQEPELTYQLIQVPKPTPRVAGRVLRVIAHRHHSPRHRERSHRNRELGLHLYKSLMSLDLRHQITHQGNIRARIVPPNLCRRRHITHQMKVNTHARTPQDP